MPTSTITNSRVNFIRFVRKRPVSLWYWFFFINIVEVFNMAEENTATSSHLDSYMHVYDNGTTARLYVTPWDRNTVADGYWQTVNTIQPLINRDIYLADAIDKLSTKYIRYINGWGIDITDNYDGSHTISVEPDIKFDNVPVYNFDSKYFTVNKTGNTATVGFNLADDGFISASNDGIYCNIDDLLYETINTTSYSSITANVVTAYTYDYSVTSLDLKVTNTLPKSLSTGTVYLVG